MRSPATRRRPGLVGIALICCLIGATATVVPAARAVDLQVAPLSPAQLITATYGSMQADQSCTSGPPVGYALRQCNAPWNLDAPFSGGLGNMGQDCEIDFWMVGIVYFVAFNGGPYATYGYSQRLKLVTNQPIATGTRVTVDGFGDQPGSIQIKGIHNCHKPWTGSHFLLVNETLSQEYGQLVCASVGKDSSGNNLTEMTMRSGCHYTDQVSLTEYGNNQTTMRYYIGSPFGIQSGPWVAGTQDNDVVPYTHIAHWWDTWVFESFTDSTEYKVYEHYVEVRDEKILYGSDPETNDSPPARWQRAAYGTPANSAWMLVPVPYGM